nr:glutamine amidotransferase-like class 1 domain-containing protein 1 [Loxodonta africana]
MDFVDVDESNARWVQDFRLRSYASPAKLESIDGARYHALLIPSCPGALADLASSGSLARILQHFHSESRMGPPVPTQQDRLPLFLASAVGMALGRRCPGKKPEGQVTPVQPGSVLGALLVALGWVLPGGPRRGMAGVPHACLHDGVCAVIAHGSRDVMLWVVGLGTLQSQQCPSPLQPSVYELVRAPGFAHLPLIVEDFVKDAGASFSASEPDAVHVVLDRHLVTGQNTSSTVPAVQNLLFLCGSR